MNDESVVRALADAAGGAEVVAVERDGAMAVLLACHPERLADRAVRERVLAAATAAGIRNLAVELVDDDGAASRLPRD